MKTYPRTVLFGNFPVEIPDEEAEKRLIAEYEELEELFFRRIEFYNDAIIRAMDRFANINYDAEIEQETLDEIHEAFDFYNGMMDYLEKVSNALAPENMEKPALAKNLY